jgi:glycosyltransferase involved in cell wall biosynthesis
MRGSGPGAENGVRVVRLSALVCVQNQDAQLSECLRGLSFCDEIVVVADRCTDRSQEIARRQGATVIDGIFPLENQRKAAGVEACSGEWVLELDADELVDRALAWEIRAVLQMRPQADCFEIPIDNYVGDARVRDGWLGQLSATRGVRLYKRGLKAWRAVRRDDGHAAPGCTVSELKGAIRRNLGPDVGGLFERMNRLTALAAEDLADSAAAKPRGNFLGAAGQFAKSYLLRAGWREGRLGLLVALMNALYPVVSRMRALEVMEARQAAMAEASRPTRLREVVGLSR